MIVQAHGHFDLLHYGHLKHLQAARLLAESFGGWPVLVVTITAGRHMTKFGHPIFTDEQRLEMLSEFRCVDRVEVVDDPGPYKAIDQIDPDIYVKGIEYEGRLPEHQYCIDRGIQVKFLGEKLFGSTRLKSLLPVA